MAAAGTRAPAAPRATRTAPAAGELGVIAALPEELADLERRISGARRLRVDRFRAVRGEIAGSPLTALRSGDGRRNAEEGALALLERFAVARLLVIGFCGGLSPDLEAGTLVVARRVLDGHTAACAPDREWVDRVTRRSGARRATFVSTGQLLCSAASKRAVRDAAARDGLAVVDLETAAVAAVARSRGVPYVAIRVVSDPAGEPLPLDFNRFVDASGSVRRWAVVAHALGRPGIVAALWRLRQRARQNSGRLADAVSRLLQGDER